MFANISYGGEHLLGSSNDLAENPLCYASVLASMLANSKMDDQVSLGQPFSVLLTNLSEEQVFISKHMNIAKTLDRSQLVIRTKVALLDSRRDAVASVHYKP